jgi:hypothetical protein
MRSDVDSGPWGDLEVDREHLDSFPAFSASLLLVSVAPWSVGRSVGWSVVRSFGRSVDDDGAVRGGASPITVLSLYRDGGGGDDDA